MRKRWILLILLLIGLLIVAAIAWFGSPRLTHYLPQDAALDVPAGSSIRLTFSRPMQPDSVAARFRIDPVIRGSISWQDNTMIFTPEQPWPAGETVQVSLDSGARAANWFSLPVRQTNEWEFTVRSPRLLYLYPANGTPNLFSLDTQTQETRQLTNLPGGVLELDATADGQAVYYSAENSEGGSDLYRLVIGEDSIDSPASLILACEQAECRAPRISPQEDFLAFERTFPSGQNQRDYSQVWLVALAKQTAPSGQVVLTPDGEPRLAGDSLHQTYQPDWSSTGILSFYDSNQKDFIVLDPRTGESTQLPNQTGETGSWSPSGTVFVAPEIIFNQGGNPQTAPDLKPVASSHLMRFNIEQGTVDDLTQVENYEDTAPAFSPDGAWLAFARKYLDIIRWTPGRQLWIMQPNGSGAQQLTDNPDYNHYNFSWDAAGEQIAFVRFNQTSPTDLPTIWVYDLGQGFETELIVGGYSPHWIP